MRTKPLVTLILTLALAAANAAPLSAVVTCSAGDGPAGCSCAPGPCCPEETPDGPGLNAPCCTAAPPDAAPVETAPAPTTQSDDGGNLPGPAAVPEISDPAADPYAAPGATDDPPPEESPPRYALFCAYLI